MESSSLLSLFEEQMRRSMTAIKASKIARPQEEEQVRSFNMLSSFLFLDGFSSLLQKTNERTLEGLKKSLLIARERLSVLKEEAFRLEKELQKEEQEIYALELEKKRLMVDSSQLKEIEDESLEAVVKVDAITKELGISKKKEELIIILKRERERINKNRNKKKKKKI